MKVTLKLSNGSTKELELVSLKLSVLELKSLAEGAVEIPAQSQRVVYRGKVLKDSDILCDVGVDDGHALHIVRGQALKDNAATAAVTVAAPPNMTLPASSTAPAPNASNPYAQLFAQTNNAPNVNAWATSGFGAGWAPSPTEAQAMMQNPLVMQMMEQMMRNPQLMQQVLASNPMLQNMPPEAVQQTMQLMNNPQMMQQMMQMMSGGAGSLPRSSLPAPTGNPRETYASQLEQLRAMGFPNEQANIAALQQCQGNIEFAIERLLGA